VPPGNTDGLCECDVGFYDANATTSGSEPLCVLCPLGAACSSAGVTLATLPIKRGGYRLSANSADVERCPDAAANCSGAAECPYSTSGCRGTVNGSLALSSRRLADDAPGAVGCYDDLTGVFCKRCAGHGDDNGVAVYYSAALASERAQCRECGDLLRNVLLVLFLGVLVGGGALLLLGVACYRSFAPKARAQLSDAWATFEPHHKLKTLVGFFMIAVHLNDVYEVELPPAVLRMLDGFAVLISLGFSGLGTVLECLEMPGYTATLACYVVVPVVLVIGFLLGSLRCFRKQRTLVEAALPPTLKLTFLAYPLLTNYAFRGFACYRFVESAWLKADVAVECGSADHDEAVALASVAIGLYSAGLLAIHAALLHSARHAIVHQRPTALSRAIAFLHREFRPEAFWWELVEMMRRLVLVGLMVLAEGKMVELLVATLLSVLFLLMQMRVQPYTSRSDNDLAAVASFALVVIFLCGSAFQVQMWLTGLSDVQAQLSASQRDRFDVNQDVLTALILLAVIGVLVLPCVLLLAQCLDERAKEQREALWVREGRLRYKEGHFEAQAPDIQDCHFHLFLSHVWSAGQSKSQDTVRIIKQRLLELVPALLVFLDIDDVDDVAELEDGGSAGYIERSETMLVHCSDGYFRSKSCMRELIAVATMQRPTLALVEPVCTSNSGHHEGLSLAEVRAHLLQAAEAGRRGLYEQWGFAADAPQARQLYDHLFALNPIEWNRVGHFQDVTMRLIAERLLGPNGGHAGTTYVARELVSKKLRPLPAPHGGHHIYCSPLNPGATDLVMEASRKQGFYLHVNDSAADAVTSKLGDVLHVTTELESLLEADHMLLYLTTKTWTRGPESEKLCAELLWAMDLGIHILLAHEMPGVGGHKDERNGCEFEAFLSNPKGVTPPKLLQRGLYSGYAIELKAGAWREASMALLGMALGMSKAEIETAKEGGDPLGLQAASSRVKTWRVKQGRKLSSKFKKASNAVGRAVSRRVTRRKGDPRAGGAQKPGVVADDRGALSDEESAGTETYRSASTTRLAIDM